MKPTARCPAGFFSRRAAAKMPEMVVRGLKPTATVIRSLRDEEADEIREFWQASDRGRYEFPELLEKDEGGNSGFHGLLRPALDRWRPM